MPSCSKLPLSLKALSVFYALSASFQSSHCYQLIENWKITRTCCMSLIKVVCVTNDWLIDWCLTSSEQFFTYIQDECHKWQWICSVCRNHNRVLFVYYCLSFFPRFMASHYPLGISNFCYHIIYYLVHLSMIWIGLTNVVMIGTDYKCTGEINNNTSDAITTPCFTKLNGHDSSHNQE